MPRTPASARASRIARTWFVGRQYQSMAARGPTSPGQGPPPPADPPQQLLDERGVLVESPAGVLRVVLVPGQAEPRQLGDRDDREALVIRLVEAAVLVPPT